mmetsp:Transcript_55522/g.81131  ORF Transcript_55522/g.81131 Transcript_55522/m.81131 type:complete len:124 (-) Transcript_55522:166-537(-)
MLALVFLLLQRRRHMHNEQYDTCMQIPRLGGAGQHQRDGFLAPHSTVWCKPFPFRSKGEKMQNTSGKLSLSTPFMCLLQKLKAAANLMWRKGAFPSMCLLKNLSVAKSFWVLPLLHAYFIFWS